MITEIEYQKNKKKIYVKFDVSRGYPAGDNLYYQCLCCGDSIPSLPKDSVACSCGGIAIDVDYGRVHVDDPDQLRAFLIVAD